MQFDVGLDIVIRSVLAHLQIARKHKQKIWNKDYWCDKG